MTGPGSHAGLEPRAAVPLAMAHVCSSSRGARPLLSRTLCAPASLPRRALWAAASGEQPEARVQGRASFSSWGGHTR